MPGKLWPTLFGEKKVIKYIWRSTWLEPKPAFAAGSLLLIVVLLAAAAISMFSLQDQSAKMPVPPSETEETIKIIEVGLPEKEAAQAKSIEPVQPIHSETVSASSENAPLKVEADKERKTSAALLKKQPEDSLAIEPETQAGKKEKIQNLLNSVPLTEFGWQYNRIYQDWRFNPGINLAADEPEIPAITGGYVEDVIIDRRFALTVIVTTNQYKIYYASLSSTPLKKNDKVNVGDTIGVMGISEGETKPHLHLVVKSIATSKYVNPLEALRK